MLGEVMKVTSIFAYVFLALVVGYFIGSARGKNQLAQDLRENENGALSRSSSQRSHDHLGDTTSPTSPANAALERKIVAAGSSDMVDLFLQAQAIGDPIDRQVLIAQCLLKMNSDNWEELLASFDTSSATSARNMSGDWKNALTRCGQVAGKEAMEKWNKVGLDKMYDQPWNTMYGWTMTNPSEAVSWLKNEETQGAKIPVSLYHAVLAGAAVRSTDDVMNMLKEMPPEVLQGSAGHLVWNTAQTGGFSEMKNLLAHTDAMSNNEMTKAFSLAVRKEVEDKFLWSASNANDPILAVKHIQELAREPEDVPPLISKAIGKFSSNNPVSGLQILDQFISDPQYQNVAGLRETIAKSCLQLLQKSPENRQQWIEQHPDSPLNEVMNELLLK